MVYSSDNHLSQLLLKLAGFLKTQGAKFEKKQTVSILTCPFHWD